MRTVLDDRKISQVCFASGARTPFSCSGGGATLLRRAGRYIFWVPKRFTQPNVLFRIRTAVPPNILPTMCSTTALALASEARAHKLDPSLLKSTSCAANVIIA